MKAILTTLIMILSLSVSAQNEMNLTNISIYPNPTTVYFKVKDDSEVAKIEVYNIIGRKIESFSHKEGDVHDVSTYKNGMYIVRLLNDKHEMLKTLKLSVR